jgi:hypothetical protein
MPALRAAGWADACAAPIEDGWPTATRSVLAHLLSPADVDRAGRILLGGIPPEPDEPARRQLAAELEDLLAPADQLPDWASIAVQLADEVIFARPTLDLNEAEAADVRRWPPVEVGASAPPVRLEPDQARRISTALLDAAVIVDAVREDAADQRPGRGRPSCARWRGGSGPRRSGRPVPQLHQPLRKGRARHRHRRARPSPAHSKAQSFRLREHTDWVRLGAETYGYVFDVLTGDKSTRWILKSCVAYVPGLPPGALLERWLSKRRLLAHAGVETPVLVGFHNGTLLEEYVPLSWDDAAIAADGVRQSALLARAAFTLGVVNGCRFSSLSLLGDLRSRGADAVLVYFGSDLGEPAVTSIETSVDLEELLTWAESRLNIDIPFLARTIFNSFERGSKRVL